LTLVIFVVYYFCIKLCVDCGSLLPLIFWVSDPFSLRDVGLILFVGPRRCHPERSEGSQPFPSKDSFANARLLHNFGAMQVPLESTLVKVYQNKQL